MSFQTNKTNVPWSVVIDTTGYTNRYAAYTTTEALTHEYNYTYTEFAYDRLSRARLLFANPYNITEFILSTIAVILNSFTLLALTRVPGRSSAHFQLIKSLACSDILIAVTCMIHDINNAFNPVLFFTGSDQERRVSFCMRETIQATYATGLTISLLNLLLMAIDHYVAILKPLYHDRLLSKRRTRMLVASCWVLAFVFGYSDFYVEFYNIFITSDKRLE